MLFDIKLTKTIICFMKNGNPVGSGVILDFDGNPFMCTCGHVIAASPDEIVLNNKSAEKNKFKIATDHFRFHKDADIALAPLNTKNLAMADLDIAMVSEPLYYGSNEFKKLSLGDAVFALGFPLGLGLVGEKKNYPILRGGLIARLDEECIEQNHYFLIDSNIFPGNSGGPVFLKPEVYGIEPIDKGYLLGIVSGYIPYVDKLIDGQTHKVIFNHQEHSGLSMVVPIHYAKEVYDGYNIKTVSN